MNYHIIFVISVCTGLLCAIVFTDAAGNTGKGSGDTNSKEILVINSYHLGFKWLDDIIDAVGKRIDGLLPDSRIFYEFLDTKNFPAKAHLGDALNEMRIKYRNTKIDLIITTDNEALHFIIQNRSQIFPDAPIVFCGINNYDPERIAGHKHITGIVETTNLKANYDMILKLHPRVKSIVLIINSKTPMSKIDLDQLESLRPEIESRVDVVTWNADSILKDVDMVRGLGPDSVVLCTGSSLNPDGTFVDAAKQGRLLSQASSVPIYSMWDFHLGTGVIGGYMVNGTDQGNAAADLAIRILKGQSADDIPVITDTPSSYMFDYKQLKRFGISLKSLPEGSVVINKPVSIYEEHKAFVWMTAASISFLSILVVLLSIHIKMRVRVEKKLKEYQDTLEDRVVERTRELQEALSKVKTLKGLLPICSHCKKIRDDSGYWRQIEAYIADHSDAEFSHGICKECAEKYYPDIDIYNDDEE